MFSFSLIPEGFYEACSSRLAVLCFRPLMNILPSAVSLVSSELQAIIQVVTSLMYCIAFQDNASNDNDNPRQCIQDICLFTFIFRDYFLVWTSLFVIVGFHLTSCMLYMFVTFIKFREFSTIVSSNTFSTLLFFWNSDKTNTGPVTTLAVPEVLHQMEKKVDFLFPGWDDPFFSCQAYGVEPLTCPLCSWAPPVSSSLLAHITLLYFSVLWVSLCFFPL